jgi:hypothetical protein
MSRLRSLLDELEVAGPAAADDPGTMVSSRDPFFTADVLASLPSRLPFTGITPRQRVALLGLFHAVAVAGGVGALWVFAPGVLGGVAQHAHGWSDALGEVSWMWGLAAVVLVALVALAATRSHPRST